MIDVLVTNVTGFWENVPNHTSGKIRLPLPTSIDPINILSICLLCDVAESNGYI